MPRNTQLKRQLRMICRMLSAPNGTPLEAFEDLRLEENITKKTLLRDLEALEEVEELGIKVRYERVLIGNREGTKKFWRLGDITKVLHPIPYVPKEKICRLCNKPKSADEYYNSKTTFDGKRSACMECESEKAKQYRIANKEKIKLQKLQWARRSKHRLNAKRRIEYQEQKLFGKNPKSV